MITFRVRKFKLGQYKNPYYKYNAEGHDWVQADMEDLPCFDFLPAPSFTFQDVANLEKRWKHKLTNKFNEGVLMKLKPSEKVFTEALRTTGTDSISVSWLQRKFNLSFLQSKELFQEMESLGLINRDGLIKIEQYPKDVEI